MVLSVRRFGSGAPLLALHGFTLTGEQFASLAAEVGREIIAPDLPGHGGSANAPTDIPSVVASILEVVTAIGAPVPVLGYSQGARLALLAALEDPTSIAAFISISGNAGIEAEQDRRNRVTQDDALAARIELFGVDRFLDEWTSSGLTTTRHLPPDLRRLDREVRAENTAPGLAAALRGYGQGSQPVVWDALGALTIPCLVVAGERDDAYVQIAHRMGRELPFATVEIIPEAGHDPLRDAPDATSEVISRFLDRLP